MKIKDIYVGQRVKLPGVISGSNSQHGAVESVDKKRNFVYVRVGVSSNPSHTDRIQYSPNELSKP